MDLVTVDKRRLAFDLSDANRPDNISDSLTIANIVSQSVAFKVKTNNQDRYIVRPNVGLIHPNKHTVITISFNPITPLPLEADAAHQKDKFLLRIAPILPHQFDTLPDFWRLSENDPIVRGLKFHVDLIFHHSPVATGQTSPLPVNAQSTTPNLSPSQKLHQNQQLHQQQFHLHDKENEQQQQQRQNQQPVVPHARDLPPELMSTPNNQLLDVDSLMKTAKLSPQQTSSLQQQLQQSNQQPEDHSKRQYIPDSSTYEEAIARVNQLQSQLDEKNLQLSRLKTELAETKAQTERVLKNAPTTPLQANAILTDPFGGISPTGFGIIFVLVIVVSIFIVK